MTIRNLDHLLKPRSIALVGASPKPGSVGLITARNLRAGGFAGPIWLVNRKYESIEGQDCYPSISDLPGSPDLGVLATPPETIPKLVAELGAKGARAVVIITAGVRKDLKRKMLQAARPSLLRIQGPNCLGLMLPRLGLNASFSHKPPLPGDLAFVSQSGALITASAMNADARVPTSAGSRAIAVGTVGMP
jgi:acetyltransferase